MEYIKKEESGEARFIGRHELDYEVNLILNRGLLSNIRHQNAINKDQLEKDEVVKEIKYLKENIYQRLSDTDTENIIQCISKSMAKAYNKCVLQLDPSLESEYLSLIKDVNQYITSGIIASNNITDENGIDAYKTLEEIRIAQNTTSLMEIKILSIVSLGNLLDTNEKQETWIVLSTKRFGSQKFLEEILAVYVLPDALELSEKIRVLSRSMERRGFLDIEDIKEIDSQIEQGISDCITNLVRRGVLEGNLKDVIKSIRDFGQSSNN